MTSMTIIDLICFGVLLLFLIAGFIKGFAKTILHLLAYVAAGFAARFASEPLTGLIYDKAIHEPVHSKLMELFPSGSIGGSMDSVLQAIRNSMSESAYKIADFLHLLPDESWLGDSFYSVEKIEESFLQPIITKVLLIVTTIALFLLLMIILNMIVKLIDKLIFKKKKGVVNSINRFFGGLLGLVQGAIPVAAACLLMNLIAPLLGIASFSDMVSHSLLCSFVASIF